MNLQHIIVGCTLVIFGHFILCHGIERTITINGGWSPWSTVATPCLREDLKGKQVLVTCGGGKMTRKRSCTNPVPQVRSLHVIGIGFNLFIFSCQMRCPREQFFSPSNLINTFQVSCWLLEARAKAQRRRSRNLESLSQMTKQETFLHNAMASLRSFLFTFNLLILVKAASK